MPTISAMKIDIDNLQLMTGHLPRRALGLALDWGDIKPLE
jgi:hypothetical protein